MLKQLYIDLPWLNVTKELRFLTFKKAFYPVPKIIKLQPKDGFEDNSRSGSEQGE